MALGVSSPTIPSNVRKQKEGDTERACKEHLGGALHLIHKSNKVSELQHIEEMLPVSKFYVRSFIVCFSDVLVLFGSSSAGEINKVMSLLGTGKQNILLFFSKNVLKLIFRPGQ